MHHGEKSFNKHLSVVTSGQKTSGGAFLANFNLDTGAFAAFRIEPVSFSQPQIFSWSLNPYFEV